MSYSWSGSFTHGRPANDDPSMCPGGGGEPGQGWMPQVQEADPEFQARRTGQLSTNPSAKYSGPAIDYTQQDSYNWICTDPPATSSFSFGQEQQGLIGQEQGPPSLLFETDFSTEPGRLYPASAPVPPPPEPIASLPQNQRIDSTDPSPSDVPDAGPAPVDTASASPSPPQALKLVPGSVDWPEGFYWPPELERTSTGGSVLEAGLRGRRAGANLPELQRGTILPFVSSFQQALIGIVDKM
ncbi:hypothetical protein PG996_011399 [Apiospora saccharicola]|uniref:Uncharacterized protein n=1 Tax=Apiospora saccharicola TaxID=335842 RepID=A0ABR1UEY0_9PEZI